MLLPPSRSRLGATIATVAALTAVTGAVNVYNTTNITPSSAFTYNASTFFLNGAPHTIIGGQMDPQRIPYQYWRDRLHKARAMGLNTIFAYVYWNLLEPTSPTDWTPATDPQQNISHYISLAAEEGLRVVLRPGPYICGEREWGGFPSWLTSLPGIPQPNNASAPVDVRSSNPAFLSQATRYLSKLSAELVSLQALKNNTGGPIILVQVENEYGSYAADHAYTSALRDALRQDGWLVPLYTNDGSGSWALEGGSVPGVLAAIDGDPNGGFVARDVYITDGSKLGPLLDGEYYTLAPDTWGSNRPHNAPAEANIAGTINDLEGVLGAGNSWSFYMFHGGTNFGFGNGAILRPPGYIVNKTAKSAAYLDVFTTSYDYGAPLDESGRTTPQYFRLRETILKYNISGTVPDVPANLPLMNVPDAKMEPVGGMFDLAAGRTAQNAKPITMEGMNQSYGYILYTHEVTAAERDSVAGVMKLELGERPGDRPRDRVIVYVNGLRKGVIDATYAHPQNVTLSGLKEGDVLQLLVENLGRVDYWSVSALGLTNNTLLDPYKGVRGDVVLGKTIISGWTTTSFPLDALPTFGNASVTAPVGKAPPMFFRGKFSVPAGVKTDDPMAKDTFLAVKGGTKGVVWVNGFNLGRYWAVGPQQSLYLPGTVLKTDGENEVVVLELEPSGNQTLAVRGESERRWENKPDADYPGDIIID